MIPLDPDRSGFSQAAFAGWFWCLAQAGPSRTVDRCVRFRRWWTSWRMLNPLDWAQSSDFRVFWRRLSQSHWQIDMFHVYIRTHTHIIYVYIVHMTIIYDMNFIYMHISGICWAQMHGASGSLNIQVSWKFRGDATKQLEHKSQSQRPAMLQTAQNLPDVTNASGRKSDEHMSKPLMRSPKSRCYSARVCYSLWGSAGMHFYNYAGLQAKKNPAFAFLFWCIACCSFSILYSMSISFEGQL